MRTNDLAGVACPSNTSSCLVQVSRIYCYKTVGVNFYKVKVRLLQSPSKFGHIFANSGDPDETALHEPSH